MCRGEPIFRLRFLALPIFACAILPSTAGPIAGQWDGRFFLPGINGAVNAIATNGVEIFVGGKFTAAGSVAARNIAKWKGTRWTSLGTGVSDAVNALTFRGGVLYVGGALRIASIASQELATRGRRM